MTDFDLSEAVDLASTPALPGGHRWVICSSCRQWALALEAGGRCRQGASVVKVTSPGPGKRPLVGYSCPGRLEVVTVVARGSDEVCARPGCRNAATATAWDGGRLCQRCVWALALACYP